MSLSMSKESKRVFSVLVNDGKFLKSTMSWFTIDVLALPKLLQHMVEE